jgi:hypothetical protein
MRLRSRWSAETACGLLQGTDYYLKLLVTVPFIHIWEANVPNSAFFFKAKNGVIRLQLVLAFLLILPATAIAEDRLTPLEGVPERPYPYAILGTQPGDDLDELLELFAERAEAEPYGDTEVFQVTSPNGRSFEFTFDVWRNIGGLTIREAIAQSNRNYAEGFRVELATDVLEGTALSIERSMRQPTGELPEALALRAQLEETYGPPSKSKVDTAAGTMTLTYAWSEEGFIADLDAQPERQITFLSSGRERTAAYRPCVNSPSGSAKTKYRFQHPRKGPAMPGCVAIFRISHRARPGQTSINFKLIDYELIRLNNTETDRQIVDALTGEKDVKPSDMDL